jgi:hypothetical protein
LNIACQLLITHAFAAAGNKRDRRDGGYETCF